MKHLYLFIFFLVLSSAVRGQNSDSIEDCIVVYRQLNFLSINSQLSPLTLFMQPNGNFFLRRGHIERPDKECVIRYFFNKKGGQIKQCREKHENYNSNASSTVVGINNYFPEKYYKTKSAYLKSYIERFSIVLQVFDEHLLYNSSDSNTFRIVFPCYNYIDDFYNQHYQRYNLIRVYFNTNILIFKTGHFNQNSSFEIDFEYTYHLNRKEIKQIQKKYDGISFTDDNIYYRKNFEEQRLFEFKNKEKYYMFLRADSYEDKLENISYFNGLFNRLYQIIGNNFYEPINQCQ